MSVKRTILTDARPSGNQNSHRASVAQRKGMESTDEQRNTNKKGGEESRNFVIAGDLHELDFFLCFLICFYLCLSVLICGYFKKKSREGNRGSSFFPALRLRNQRAHFSGVSALEIAGIDRSNDEVVGLSGLDGGICVRRRRNRTAGQLRIRATRYC